MVEIRSIREDELVAWSDTMLWSFLSTVAPPAAADYRRETIDYKRSLGAFADGRVVGTFRSFATEMTLPGGAAVPASAVTNVAVAPSHRRQGLLRSMMGTDLRQSADRGEVASILLASEYPIYGRYGYGAATEHATWTFDSTRSELRTPADRRVDRIDPAAAADTLATIFDRRRPMVPGEIRRLPRWWKVDLGEVEAPGHPLWKGWVVLHSDGSGMPDGYLRYRVEEKWAERAPANVLLVDELLATDDEAEASLWQFCFGVDLIRTVKAENRRVDEPITWRLVDARAGQMTQRDELLWVRPLDVPALLEARRYTASGAVALEIVDDAGFAGGTYLLDASPSGAACRPTKESPALRLPVDVLGSVVLGGIPLSLLASARRLDVLDASCLAEADALLRWPVQPWCTTWF